jgi:Sigma-70, region 4
MLIPFSYCTPGEANSNAECLLGHIEVVLGVLHTKRFSQHAIECAVSALYDAALPYITGRKVCRIANRRAWVFKVAIRAAIRAATREKRSQSVEPAILATMVEAPQEPEERGELFDINEALSQLTQRQRGAVELCFLGRMTRREGALSMGINVGTFGRHLKAGKRRLQAILSKYDPEASGKKSAISAHSRAS